MTDIDKDRSARLKQLLIAAGYKSKGLDKLLTEKLSVPIGTARGYVYANKHPSLVAAQKYAEILNIDVVYWLMGLKTEAGEINQTRLKYALIALNRLNSKHPDIEFSLDQTVTLLTDFYTDKEKTIWKSNADSAN